MYGYIFQTLHMTASRQTSVNCHEFRYRIYLYIVYVSMEIEGWLIEAGMSASIIISSCDSHKVMYDSDTVL